MTKLIIQERKEVRTQFVEPCYFISGRYVFGFENGNLIYIDTNENEITVKEINPQNGNFYSTPVSYENGDIYLSEAKEITKEQFDNARDKILKLIKPE